jgi:hypothetical protein
LDGGAKSILLVDPDMGGEGIEDEEEKDKK